MFGLKKNDENGKKTRPAKPRQQEAYQVGDLLPYERPDEADPVRDGDGQDRRAKKRRRLPGDTTKEYAPPIRLRSIDGHLARTGDQVYAWYRLAPQRWSFRSDAERSQLIRVIAAQHAELVGRWLHVRVTARPYPAAAWAEAHDDNSPNRLPDVPGTPSWDDYLLAEQEQILGEDDEQPRAPMAEKEVYLGVQVQVRSMAERVFEKVGPPIAAVWPRLGEFLTNAELAGIESEVSWLDQIVASQGLEGEPVSPEEMSWLMYRSCGLGLPAPLWRPAIPSARWETEDLAGFTDSAAMYCEPNDPTVVVRGRSGANAGVERHTAVCAVGRMDKMQIPESHEPWAQRADRLGEVEISAHIYVQRNEEVMPVLTRQMSKIRSQVRHYEHEHKVDAPRSLARQADRVLDVEDEMSLGFADQSTRVEAWWRVAVSGETRREALARVRQLIKEYKPQVAIEHPTGMYALAREFIPGEPLAAKIHTRRGSVRWLACAVPQVTAQVGDRRGIRLGETASATARPVMWDPWLAQETSRGSGLTVIPATLGAGKTTLAGATVYKTVRAGASWTVLDPSGLLAELCRILELRRFARHADLMDGDPGIMNPYRLIRDPDYEDSVFSDLGERRSIEAAARAHDRALLKAAAARRRLTLDVLRGLLPHELARMPQSRIVLMRAVRSVGDDPAADPGMVIDKLRCNHTEHRDHATAVADHLDEMRERLSLLIPESRGEDPYAVERDDRLTVLTMGGLTLPGEGVSPEHWDDEQQLGMQLLNLAAWLTQRQVYQRPKHERKGVFIDEAFFISSVPSGRVLMDRFYRDSRKWNLRVLLATQVPQDVLRIPGFASLVNSAFIGQLNDTEVQADALRLLGVPTGVGYEHTLGTLAPQSAQQTRSGEIDRTPRQFVFKDGFGGIERIRVSLAGPHLANLREALESTPGAKRIARPQLAPFAPELPEGLDYGDRVYAEADDRQLDLIGADAGADGASGSNGADGSGADDQAGSRA